MPSSLNSTSNAHGSRLGRAIALGLLTLSALSLAAIAGCSSLSNEGKSVSGLDNLIQAESIRTVPAHPQPGWQAHPSSRAVIVRQPAPHCELPRLEPDTVDADLWSRLKLDYEQHCHSYKRAAMLVRRKVRGPVEAMIDGDRMAAKVEGTKGAVPNAVAPSDSNIVVPDAAAAPAVVGPTSTGTVSASGPLEDAKFYRESAIAAYRNGDVALALVYFDRAIRFDPSFEGAYIDRSIVLYRLGALDFAFDDVAHAIVIENSHRILTPPLPKTSPLSKNN